MYHWVSLCWLLHFFVGIGSLHLSGNPHYNGRLSTLDLLIKITCLVKKKKIFFSIKTAVPNYFMKGSQLNWYFPFSKDSVNLSLVWFSRQAFKGPFHLRGFRDLPHKYYNRQDRYVINKCSSLLGHTHSDEEKKFYNVDTRKFIRKLSMALDSCKSFFLIFKICNYNALPTKNRTNFCLAFLGPMLWNFLQL